MYITRPTRASSNGKIYETVLLRESFRQDGRVKNRTLANLTHCKPEEIAAIELALKHKGDLSALASLSESVELEQGPSVGGVWTAYQMAKRLGVEKALGSASAGKLALWQVIARVLEQGSRLSAARLAQTCAACDALGIAQDFNEDTLYANLKWLSQRQEEIEQRLLRERRGGEKPQLFLYDVTSSYLEGEKNELAAYGYNRDRKQGKKQIVIGLLCDESGAPVSTEVFRGNTQDVATFAPQVRKAAERFGCERVTLVGDRGMIKAEGIQRLQEAGFHYITAITKPQIRMLLKQGVVQMEFFDEDLYELEEGSARYILKRNPARAKQLQASREEKRQSVETFTNRQNEYLAAHPKASLEKAQRRVQAKIERLRIDAWLTADAEGRKIVLRADENALQEAASLDGCYMLKTDLPAEAASKALVHERYKDLAEVEWAFRTCKTAHLEIRPVYVRKEESTRGHALTVMLAYLIVRELRRAWQPLNLTVEEGLRLLSTLSAIEIKVKNAASCWKIPKPAGIVKELLDALDVRMPQFLPRRQVKVVTRKKLPSRRKSS